MTLDDAKPKLTSALSKQLTDIASAHGGQVPLHGRLFAQWLHYVFPQECAFPHKSGVASTATPTEFGDNFIASHEDMHKHVQAAVEVTTEQSTTEDEVMSQWDHEE